MGHPKKLRKKWKRPRKMFDRERIKFEKELKKKYGFKRKKEIWKLEYDFKNIIRRARKILATKDKEAEKILLNKLVKYGLINEKSDLEDVLNLKLDDFCSRRLQTIVYKKGIANTINHARQLITHKKIIVGDRIINQPNYFVSKEEEKKIKLKEKPKKDKSEKKEEKSVNAENVSGEKTEEDMKVKSEETKKETEEKGVNNKN